MISQIKASADITLFDVILSVANDLEPSWMGTSNVALWQHPRGLKFRALPVDFA
jgi:hypothetical protein